MAAYPPAANASREGLGDRGGVVDWTFGTFLWAMLVIFFWLVALWVFIAVFADIMFRDMSGWAKAGWILLVVLLPFLGTLIYLIARPKDAGRFARLGAAYPDGGQPATGQPAKEYSAPGAIATAARLRDEGKITPDEYERLKQRALSY
jgi:Phospholipase_D-nuclease N-terminal